MYPCTQSTLITSRARSIAQAVDTRVLRERMQAGIPIAGMRLCVGECLTGKVSERFLPVQGDGGRTNALNQRRKCKSGECL